MATKQSTIDYLVEQMSGAGIITSRKMFGEYAIYCDEKVVAFVCDDKLYVKPTTAGRNCIQALKEAPPYAGAKLYFYISGDYWEDKDWLSLLIAKTAEELPLPKKKKLINRTKKLS